MLWKGYPVLTVPGQEQAQRQRPPLREQVMDVPLASVVVAPWSLLRQNWPVE